MEKRAKRHQTHINHFGIIPYKLASVSLIPTLTHTVPPFTYELSDLRDGATMGVFEVIGGQG